MLPMRDERQKRLMRGVSANARLSRHDIDRVDARKQTTTSLAETPKTSTRRVMAMASSPPRRRPILARSPVATSLSRKNSRRRKESA